MLKVEGERAAPLCCMSAYNADVIDGEKEISPKKIHPFGRKQATRPYGRIAMRVCLRPLGSDAVDVAGEHGAFLLMPYCHRKARRNFLRC